MRKTIPGQYDNAAHAAVQPSRSVLAFLLLNGNATPHIKKIIETANALVLNEVPIQFIVIAPGKDLVKLFLECVFQPVIFQNRKAMLAGVQEADIYAALDYHSAVAAQLILDKYPNASRLLLFEENDQLSPPSTSLYNLKAHWIASRTCRSLNRIHTGKTIFIVGAGPQLAEISEHERQALESAISIGLNRTPYFMRLTYFLTSYPIEAMLANKHNPGSLVLLLRGGLNLFFNMQNTLTINRLKFRKWLGLNAAFYPGFPALFSHLNAALAATHLAYILGARRIVYVGVEQLNRLHFYNLHEASKCEMAQDLESLQEISIKDPYHSYANAESLRQNLNHDIETLKSAPFYTKSHVDSFKIYFNILKKKGVSIATTVQHGVILEAGGRYHPLESVLSELS